MPDTLTIKTSGVAVLGEEQAKHFALSIFADMKVYLQQFTTCQTCGRCRIAFHHQRGTGSSGAGRLARGANRAIFEWQRKSLFNRGMAKGIVSKSLPILPRNDEA